MRFHILFSPLVLLAIAAAACADEKPLGNNAPIRVTIDASKVGPPINPFLYGQFIEHLGRCIYGGIWAEMLEDRKFYYPVTDSYHPYRDQAKTKFPIVGASPWQVIGPAGSVTMATEKPFVGEHTPRIAAGSGIQQSDLELIDQKEYVGRVALRAAKGPVLASVTLIWGEGADDQVSVLARCEGDGYAELALKFRSDESTDHGRLRIENVKSTSVSGGACFIGAASLMPADNVHGFRRDTLDLLKQLGGTIYRWPGGNFVSGYDWRDGIGPRDRRPPRKNPAWTGVEHNDFGIDEFLDFCREVDAKPMIAVNTGFGDDYSAAQEVEYANGSAETIGGKWRVKNGRRGPYDVKYWCVGNEMWGPWQLGHMQLDQYTQKHNLVAKAMHRVDPNLVLVGSGDLATRGTIDNGHKRQDVSWSQGMLERCSNSMDFISEHFYSNQRRDDVSAHVAQIVDSIRKKADEHRKLQADLRQHGDLKQPMPIAMDEWNYWHRPHVYGELGCVYQLRDALGIAAGLHEYFRNSDIIHMANYAQTVNVIGCIKTTKTAAFFDATALPLLLYRREFGTTPIALKGNQSERAIDIVAAKTKDGQAITIGVVNPQATPQVIDVTIDGVKLKSSATVWRIAGNNPAAFNTAEKQAVAIAEEKNIPFGKQIRVPAYSVNLYRLQIE
jgi:alpha-N-arabinofuranosidase